MVKMPVSKEYFSDIYAKLFHSAHYFCHIPTWINQGPFHCFITPNDAAILLEGGDWNYLGFKHGNSCLLFRKSSARDHNQLPESEQGLRFTQI
jgi:hypothetical protein